MLVNGPGRAALPVSVPLYRHFFVIFEITNLINMHNYAISCNLTMLIKMAVMMFL